MKSISELLPAIKKIHYKIRETIVNKCETSSPEQMAKVDHESNSDTIYAIDRFGEDMLIDYFEQEIARDTPILLIAEGIAESGIILPENTPMENVKYRVIVDPIDGTRGLMYQKRSGWILTGVAPNLGDNTSLQDIELAIQTEIPLMKQYLSDVVWAAKGKGAAAERFNRLTGETHSLKLFPSTADSIEHGFAMISRFFPGAREVLAEIDDEVIRGALEPVQKGKAHCFEDQYLCTGGQLYELMTGHDRFNADLRPLLKNLIKKRGLFPGICCHPYDICTELIAREAGVIMTDESGDLINCKLDTTSEVTWIGYANSRIRSQIEPLLFAALNKRNLSR